MVYMSSCDVILSKKRKENTCLFGRQGTKRKDEINKVDGFSEVFSLFSLFFSPLLQLVLNI